MYTLIFVISLMELPITPTSLYWWGLAPLQKRNIEMTSPGGPPPMPDPQNNS